MNQQLTLQDCKVLWIFGVAERLQSLGFIDGSGYRIAPKTIDLFIEIDEHRNDLFPDDEEVVELFKTMVKMESEVQPDEHDLNQMCELVLEYKNHRERMMKFALEQSYS